MFNPQFRIRSDLLIRTGLEAASYFDEGVSYLSEQPSRAEGAFREATKRFESLAGQRPDHPEDQIKLAICHVNLGTIAEKDGRTSTAISEFEQAVRTLEVMAPGLPNTQRLQEHLALARRNLAIVLVTRADPTRRDPDRAVSLARQIIGSLPRDAESWRFLASISINAGSISTAIDALEQAMRLRNGGDSHEWLFLSIAHSLKLDRVQARRWYDEAVQGMVSNSPDDQELGALRAAAASLLGRSD
jgi:tetratricopeptide (TPR) repeat protein